MNKTTMIQLFGMIVLCIFVNAVIAEVDSKPVIQVIHPSTEPIPSTLNVDINFFNPSGTKIRPETLKVYYGWFNIDVTEQIMQYAVVNQFGISAKHIELPPGRHRFTLEINDTGKQLFSKEIHVHIIEKPNAKPALPIKINASRHIAGLDRR